MLPSPDDVALILRTRTRAKLGATQTGSFSADTNPTADEVTGLIARAGRAVKAVIGEYDAMQVDNPDLFGAVLDVIATRAASEVEASYFPETTDTQGSQTTLERRYETDLKRLEQAMIERESGGVHPGEGVLPQASGLTHGQYAIPAWAQGQWRNDGRGLDVFNDRCW